MARHFDRWITGRQPHRQMGNGLFEQWITGRQPFRSLVMAPPVIVITAAGAFSVPAAVIRITAATQPRIEIGLSRTITLGVGVQPAAVIVLAVGSDALEVII